ncbi:MAG TPA: indolepyruvate ferredoxin oxidoreductase subunit alpha [Methanospirillum sp.]|uniref:indolepyruvate ferredoxin oxidoreductase subunit alpha n=1 Tax=Methanospirillum sp. TaxID=45200 RepID=UPI002BEC1459|nr:indolepyruvate ferredoxin oxidoreductase subunit alpha [Methanospirillum sp.]HWQ63917.1 indolepyruvate ferredoxin oxidoreductase subunit alpha [Methanospirillum sp.]
MVVKYLLGNEAIAHGCLEAAIDTAFGYPGTPSSEVIDTLRAWPDRQSYVEWSVNEKVAYEEALASSWCGMRSIVTMKHVGLNVAADPLMTSAYTGVKGGFVVLSADDPFAHSSQNEQDSRCYAAFARIPCLDPSSVQEAHDMVRDAFSLSEEFLLPVLFRPTTRICHSKSDVNLGEVAALDRQASFEKDPRQYVVIPAHTRVLHKQLNEKQASLKKRLVESGYNRSVTRGKIGVIAGGIAASYVREVVADSVSIAQIGAYPIDDEWLSGFIRSHERILVVEELAPVIEEAARQVAGVVPILGKKTGHVPYEGELSPSRVAQYLQAADIPVKSDYPAAQSPAGLPVRPPILCAGCMHRTAMYAIRKVFRDGIFPSDIGCYTLGLQLGVVDTTICMGASITVASGMAQAGEKHDIVCTIGDSTFLHTGIQGLLNAVYNDANITVVILDNRITAMTGHQPNPTTGVTASGVERPAVSLEMLCRSCGVPFVETVSPSDLIQFTGVLKDAKARKGVKVIIAKQPCVITERRAKINRGKFRVSSNNCIGCKACIKFGCPAIELHSGIALITDLCSGCGVCTQICPVSAISPEVKE